MENNKSIEERKATLDKQFQACQTTIESEFDENQRKQISDYMFEKIQTAIEKARTDIMETEKSAYKEAMEKFGNKEKTQKIENVCTFQKWDQEFKDIMNEEK
tara:strand:+ start:236 stop:541 length:306 start_codon:yes stop_codon:yes gene_type:complete